MNQRNDLKNLKHLFFVLNTLFLLPISCKAQALSNNLFKLTDHIEVPFQYVNGFIVIDVFYGQMIPLKFIFDTGAEYSILSIPEIAHFGGTKIGRPLAVYGSDLSTKIEANILHNTTFEVGKKIFFSQLDMILLKDNYLNFDKYIGFPIHGILGANVFSMFIIEINYLKRKIVFHNPKSAVNTKGFVELPVSFHSRKPYIDLNIELANGQVFLGKYLIDSGADLSILLKLDSHPMLFSSDHAIISNIASGLGGKMSGYIGRVKSLKLANRELTSPLVHFQHRPDSIYTKTPSNGLIGNKILSLFRVIIDYPNQKLLLKPTKKRLQIRQDKSGLSVIASGPFLHIISIEQILSNSPASNAGLLAGDRILSINRRSSKYLKLATINRILSKKSGKKIRLKILRNQEKIIFTFWLKDYIK